MNRVPIFSPLQPEFYQPSTELVARDLLGKIIVSRVDGKTCAGMIVETEAYLKDDPACHAFRGKTARNAVMWGVPGRAYVYFIYGNHFCFNAVCRPKGIAEAVLIRAIEPLMGEDIMSLRRGLPAKDPTLTNGPGKLCAALGINRGHDGLDLCSAESEIFIAENPGLSSKEKETGPIIQTTRIGITKAVDLPLRFYLKDSRFVSRYAGKRSQG